MNTYTNAFPKGHKWDYTKYKEEKVVIELLNAKEECDKWLIENIPDSPYIKIDRQNQSTGCCR